VPAFDAGCHIGTVGGGSSGTGTDGEVTGTNPACPVNSADSLCDQCAFDQCCSNFTMCSESSECSALLGCIEGCMASALCIQSCESTYALGVSGYDEIANCVLGRCQACNESGTGDPCTAGYPACIAPLSCNGIYCTKQCAVSSDCLGIGAQSGNIVGTANVCVDVPGLGNTCVPACSSANGCNSYAGTYCQTTTSVEGTTVQVCSVIPDGG
jgi:hypothetical protein